MSDVAAPARALLAELGTPIADDAAPGAVADALAALERTTTDRAARKALRRERYRLAQRGFTATAPEPVPAAAPALAVDIEAWVSAVDGRGDRLAWIARERGGGGLLLVAADVNEPDGLRDLRVLEVTRKQLRRMRDRFQAEGGLRFAPADWRAVDALVVEAQDRLGEVERRLDYRRLRSRVTTRPPDAPAELASSRVPPIAAGDRAALLASSATLAEEPELRTWWPRPEQIAPWLAEVREVRESPIVVAPAQQDERLRAVLERATAALFPPAVTARRLRATAYVLAETGRVEAARRALAVAETLEAQATNELTTRDVPFLQALTHRAIGTLLAAVEAQRREQRDGALVVTPDEARAGSRARPPRAPG